MSVSNKHRYWWFLLYPESAPKDWKEILKFRGMPIAVSPLHEFDLMNEEGELKKPHYHIILCYSGPTTFNSVKALTVDELNSTIPKPLDCVKGAYDYLIHKNDPDKFQYCEDEIELLNGFDIVQMSDLSERDKAELKISIIKDIQDNNIKEYSQLIDFYISAPDYQKFNIVSTHTIFFNRYITSRRCSEFELEGNSQSQSDDDFINKSNSIEV